MPAWLIGLWFSWDKSPDGCVIDVDEWKNSKSEHIPEIHNFHCYQFHIFPLFGAFSSIPGCSRPLIKFHHSSVLVVVHLKPQGISVFHKFDWFFVGHEINSIMWTKSDKTESTIDVDGQLSPFDYRQHEYLIVAHQCINPSAENWSFYRFSDKVEVGARSSDK